MKKLFLPTTSTMHLLLSYCSAICWVTQVVWVSLVVIQYFGYLISWPIPILLLRFQRVCPTWNRLMFGDNQFWYSSDAALSYTLHPVMCTFVILQSALCLTKCIIFSMRSVHYALGNEIICHEVRKKKYWTRNDFFCKKKFQIVGIK